MTRLHSRLRRRLSGAALGAVALGGALACEQELAPPDPAPVVVATIYPVGDLTRSIAGEDVHVEVLVPPHASPATYEPMPRQIRALAGASAYLTVGGSVDAWVRALPGGLGTETRLNDGIALRPGDGGGGGEAATGDPHTWLDPLLVRDAWLPRLERVLGAARPDARERLAERTRALSDSLTALDAWLTRRLAPVREYGFVTAHAAWGYMAERYGMRELVVIYSAPGREPSARRLAALVDSARAAGVRAVFTEPQLGPTVAHALADELGVPVLVLDPLGGPGLDGREGYLSMMRFNGLQIRRALDP